MFTSQQVFGTRSPDFVDDALQFGSFTTSNMGTYQNPDGGDAEDARVEGTSILLRTQQGANDKSHIWARSSVGIQGVWVFSPDPENRTDPYDPDYDRSIVYAAGFIKYDRGTGYPSGTYRRSRARVGLMIHHSDGSWTKCTPTRYIWWCGITGEPSPAW